MATLTLDELQAKIENTLGLQLQRQDQNETRCKLVAMSPTGVPLFAIITHSTKRHGWQVCGRGQLLDSCWDDLSELHFENPQRS
ncbi:MAG: hypothetical protein MI919_13915 [Holophagales bacterium]|nr:hypothetical protein [Holophagales bacterium]